MSGSWAVGYREALELIIERDAIVRQHLHLVEEMPVEATYQLV
jgi:hypothetical protein